MQLIDWRQSACDFEYGRNNISYHYCAKGVGTPILFLHGFPTASWDWRYFWEGFLDKNKLVTLDLLGFGYSDKPSTHRYSIHEHADIVERLLEHLGLVEIHLAAHDIGNNIAQELLARYHEGKTHFSICSTFFLNGALFPDLQRHTVLQSLMSSSLGFLFSALTTRAAFESQFRSIFDRENQPDEDALADVWQLVSYQRGHKLNHRLMSYIHDRKTYGERWVNALCEASDIPSLYINGNSDPICGTHMLEEFEKLIGESSAKGLNGVGHYPHCEQPELVIRLYKQFLNTL